MVPTKKKSEDTNIVAADKNIKSTRSVGTLQAGITSDQSQNVLTTTYRS